MTTLTLPSGIVVEIDEVLYKFVNDEVVPGTRKSADEVFGILGELVVQFGPKNQILLDKRAARQSKIDEYYLSKRKAGWEPTEGSSDKDAADIAQFLMDQGYLESEIDIEVDMETPELDGEMSQNGPELVTPVNIVSMAVGGANARWGSLYDAYFLSDIHPEIDRDTNRAGRLQMVVEQTNAYLEANVAQWESNLSFDNINSYSVRQIDGQFVLVGHSTDGSEAGLQDPSRFVGFNQEGDHLTEFFLEDNGLKIQFQLYEGGSVDPENGQFKDLIVESAVTNIVDFEDCLLYTSPSPRD